MHFTRITVDAKQMGGVPCIRRLRIPVATIVGMVADDMTVNEILKSFPDLEREDIREALHYAAEALQEREIPHIQVTPLLPLTFPIELTLKLLSYTLTTNTFIGTILRLPVVLLYFSFQHFVIHF